MDGISEAFLAQTFVELEHERGYCFHLVPQIGSDTPLHTMDLELLDRLMPAVVQIIVADPAWLHHALTRLEGERTTTFGASELRTHFGLPRQPLYFLAGDIWCAACAAQPLPEDPHGEPVFTAVFREFPAGAAIPTCSQCGGAAASV